MRQNRAEIQWLPLDVLHSHPDNPRLFMRDEVVDTISQSIKEHGFEPCYAILVRPINGGYQVISGHHRLEACRRAGASHIAAWVKPMDDEEAFDQLKAANNQGELTAFEEGKHAFDATDKGKWGRSLNAYVDKHHEGSDAKRKRLERCISAYRVWRKVGHQCPTLLDYPTHASLIEKAPESDWPWLVSELLKEEWSVKDTEAAVKAVSTIGDIPEWLTSWLDPDKWKRKVIKDENLASSVKRWIETATSKYEALDAEQEVWLFDEGGKPYRASINMRAEFVQMLGDIKTPSDLKIGEKYSAVIGQVEKYENAYEEWRLAQESEENAKRLRQQREKTESECPEVFAILNMPILKHLHNRDPESDWEPVAKN